MKQTGDRRQEKARIERSDGREGRREKEKSEGVSVYGSEKGREVSKQRQNSCTKVFCAACVSAYDWLVL